MEEQAKIPAIDKETAQVEIERWAKASRVRLERPNRDENDAKDIEGAKEIFLEEVMRGALIVTNAGKASFTPDPEEYEDPVNPIIFNRPKGAALMAMDKKKPTAKVGQMYAVMGELTGRPTNFFSKLDYADLEVCMAITTLFLG